jgi:hypothetical protein
MEHKQKWQLFGSLGVLTIGFGLSLIGEATIRKGKSEPWVLIGSLGLAIVNAGVSVFGDAIKERALYEIRELRRVES